MNSNRYLIFTLTTILFILITTAVNTAVGNPLPLPTPFSLTPTATTPSTPPSAPPANNHHLLPTNLPDYKALPPISIWQTYHDPATQIQFSYPTNWTIDTDQSRWHQPYLADYTITLRNDSIQHLRSPLTPDQFYFTITAIPLPPGYTDLTHWVENYPLFNGRSAYSKHQLITTHNHTGLRWLAAGPDILPNTQLTAFEHDQHIILVTSYHHSNHQPTLDTILNSITLP
ncbi:MAG TPA: hypothetical protein VLL52_23615 [Anaerolineae bacterium]|nr:hypothetical protein [Anaerolineae bacterium]